MEEQHLYSLKVYLHTFSSDQDVVRVDFHKRNTTSELIDMLLKKLCWNDKEASPDVELESITEGVAVCSESTSASSDVVSATPAAHVAQVKANSRSRQCDYELCEIMGTRDGQTCKERVLDAHEYPVKVQLLWPKILPTSPLDQSTSLTEYRFVLRTKRSKTGSFGHDGQGSAIDSFLAKFLQQPKDKEYPDLCMLPELTEATLLENLRDRFNSGHIYTYIGPILVAVNPFKFFPIYNPKYVKLYQNRKSFNDMPPHVFAIADATYHMMLKEKQNQCIVISGESGSGKTESTNFLLHHLTALSQKGSAATGVEQTLLGAIPVLEAFGNSVTGTNNNSSRFGKFIQVNYRENGIVCGANVQIYLLEKSRIISQAAEERNYHVFYYLLAGASEDEKRTLNLLEPEKYHYLNQNDFYAVKGVDDLYEYNRLRQSMELVGFSSDSHRKLFSVLSAVLLLGNVIYTKRTGYHVDDIAMIDNEGILKPIAELLHVKEEKLVSALTTKRTITKAETVITRYKVAEAIASRDAMAKCLYNALFDWIVLKLNQALLKSDASAILKGRYIGILDIFGFEDVGAQWNSFEQLCINFTNERLQLYFNQHIFQFEQEEYQNQGIAWTNIEYTDNAECLQLMQGKPYGLFHLLDEECSISRATDETLLEKFNKYHKNNEYYEIPHKGREMAIIIAHYAGKVKYQIKGFREKNNDLMRSDIVNALKNSKSAFVRELLGNDPVAVFRWAVVRASFRAMFAFRESIRSRRLSAARASSLDVERPLTRRSSESQLQAFLRGDIDGKSVPSYCDMSVIDSIREHLNPKTLANVHAINRILTASSRRNSVSSFVRSRKNLFEDRQWHSNNNNNQTKCSNRKSSAQLQSQHSFGSSDLAAANTRVIPNSLTAIRESLTEFTDCIDALNEAELIVKRGPIRRHSQKGQKGIKGLQTLKAVAGKRIHGRRMMSTVGGQFQHSLTRLMDTLAQATPFFIRCIKSNNDKIPCLFDEDIILRQLRYTGMLETVRIRRAGYSVRLTYAEFVSQYRILLPNGVASSKDDAIAFIFNHALLERQNFQFGLTKIFMRDAEKLLLDDQLHRTIMAYILRLQSWFRTYLLRQRFLRMRQSIVVIQAHVRTFLVRQRLKHQYLAAVVIQSEFRAYRERHRFLNLRRCIIAFQARCRGYLIRQGASSRTEILQLRFAKIFGTSLPYETSFIDPESDVAPLSSVEAEIRDVCDGGKGFSPSSSSTKENDEGIVTKTSSQDDAFGSSPKERPHFRADSDEESSGILDGDSDTATTAKYLRDRAMSLEAEFVLEEGAKLKLVSIDLERQRCSLTPSTSSSIGKLLGLRKTASSDTLRDSTNLPATAGSAMKKPGNEPILFKTVPLLPGRSAKQKAAAKKTSGFFKAKQQFKAIINRLSDAHSEDSDFENEASTITAEQSSAIDSSSAEASKLSAVSAAGSQLGKISICVTQSHCNKMIFFQRLEICALCKANITGFFRQGYKCSNCRQCFHKECSQLSGRVACVPKSPASPEGGVLTSHARHLSRNWEPSITTQRRSLFSLGSRQTSKSLSTEQRSEGESLGFFLNKASQFTDSAEQVVGSFAELRQISSFISFKIIDLAKQSQRHRDTVVDAVFKLALSELHTQLLSMQATVKEREGISLKYKDLIHNFEHALNKACLQEHMNVDNFPSTIGINAFRGYLNEFLTHRKAYDSKGKTKSFRKKRRKSDYTIHLGHKFKADLVNIPTYCEICNQFMWHSEKILICQGCRISCHKKCYTKVVERCLAESKECINISQGRLFGAELGALVDEENLIPIALEKMLSVVELKGLYVEGIYRKSGAIAQVKQYRRMIETTPDYEQLSFDETPIHVLATLIKAFFRELPEPLMTYDLYENFLHVAEVPDVKERLRCIFSMVELLPKINRAVLDRVMYHLARIAYQADVNRMSTQNLAVIFAPSFLKRNQVVKAQEQLNDVTRQTICVQVLIEEKLRQYLATISEIVKLETVAEKVSTNLRKIEEHFQDKDCVKEMEQARQLFKEQLDFLDFERDKLIDELPPLAPVASSEDDCVTSSDEFETPVCSHREKKSAKLQQRLSIDRNDEYAIDFGLPAMPPKLRCLTKNRARRQRTRRRKGVKKPLMISLD